MISDVLKSNSIAIMGMCKNAGKTTVLNALIKGMNCSTLALTSIGRDGESTDLATATPKPDVYVQSGTLFATASKMLRYCDTTLEILDTCGIYTPLGEVVIAKAHSDGNIQIAGPSTVSGLQRIHTILKDFGAQRTIFDGAISRKSLSVPSLCKETILCSGASYSASMRMTVEDTAFFARLFTLNIFAEETMPNEKFTAFYRDHIDTTSTLQNLKSIMMKNKAMERIRITGAVTDSIIIPMLEFGVRDAFIIADDPSKILISKKCFEKCEARNMKLSVSDRSTLSAVTVNPFSAYGASYDENAFFDAMSDALAPLGIPVFDVKRKDMSNDIY